MPYLSPERLLFPIVVLILSLLLRNWSYSYLDDDLSSTPSTSAFSASSQTIVQQWEREGKYISFPHRPWLKVFTHVSSSSSSSSRSSECDSNLLILHGFPTSSLDFRSALPLLHQRFAKIVLFGIQFFHCNLHFQTADHLSYSRSTLFILIKDFLGFGLSSKPSNYSYSLMEQAELALEVRNYSICVMLYPRFQCNSQDLFQ